MLENSPLSGEKEVDVEPAFDMMERLVQEKKFDSVSAMIGFLGVPEYQRVSFFFEYVPTLYHNSSSLFHQFLDIALASSSLKPLDRYNPIPYIQVATSALHKNREQIAQTEQILHDFISQYLVHPPIEVRFDTPVAIRLLDPDSALWKLPYPLARDLCAVSRHETKAWTNHKWELFAHIASQPEIPERLNRLGQNALLLSVILFDHPDYIPSLNLLIIVLPDRLFEETFAIISRFLDPAIKVTKPERIAALKKALLDFLDQPHLKRLLGKLISLYTGKENPPPLDRNNDSFNRTREAFATLSSKDFQKLDKHPIRHIDLFEVVFALADFTTDQASAHGLTKNEMLHLVCDHAQDEDFIQALDLDADSPMKIDETIRRIADYHRKHCNPKRSLAQAEQDDKETKEPEQPTKRRQLLPPGLFNPPSPQPTPEVNDDPMDIEPPAPAPN